jgi:hypothetical protein
MYRISAYFRPHSCGGELDEAQWGKAQGLACRIWALALLASVGMAVLWVMI